MKGLGSRTYEHSNCCNLIMKAVLREPSQVLCRNIFNLLVVTFVFQERFDKVDYGTKLLIKEQVCQIAFSKMSLNPPNEKVKIKDASKNFKCTPTNWSTKYS